MRCERSRHLALPSVARLLAVAVLLMAMAPDAGGLCYGTRDSCNGWGCYKLPISLPIIDFWMAVDPGMGGWVSSGNPCGWEFCWGELVCPCGFETPLASHYDPYC